LVRTFRPICPFFGIGLITHSVTTPEGPLDRPGRPRTYTAKDVPWRLRDQFQLRAVLLPLTGHYHNRGEIPVRALSIRRRWWWLINRLRARGWAPLTTPQIHRQARY
jgi:hypothetical protein